MPLPSIPDLEITTKPITIAVGGHMTIRKWISTTNPQNITSNATENAFRQKPGFSHQRLGAQLGRSAALLTMGKEEFQN